ncbi:MAG: cyclic nucleotide-binding domain-containing protein [Chitinivibrionales bacterium]|nr:cyclic nucleotide-binding domain-containing protein [Chitinivibrionales bacterium]
MRSCYSWVFPEKKFMPNEEKKLVEYQGGDIVIQEGKLAEELFVLLNGTLEVSVKGVKVAEISRKGSYVGEIASLLSQRRIATVKALTASKFLVIDNMNRYFEQNPSAALGIAQALAARIMEMNDKIIYYQNEVENWVKLGEEALKMKDLGPIREALSDMQRLLLDVKVDGNKGKMPDS